MARASAQGVPSLRARTLVPRSLAGESPGGGARSLAGESPGGGARSLAGESPGGGARSRRQPPERSGDGRRFREISAHPVQVQRFHDHHQVGFDSIPSAELPGSVGVIDEPVSSQGCTGCGRSWGGPRARGHPRCERRSCCRRRGPAAWPPPSASGPRCQCTPCTPPAARASPSPVSRLKETGRPYGYRRQLTPTRSGYGSNTSGHGHG